MYSILYLLTFSIELVSCRDFYMGIFNRNDYLVAQDTIYKNAVPYSYTYAKYGRVFKCPITYLRVVDRYGVGRGPTVEIVHGGLGKNHILARIRSTYNMPISVNIYVGCENKIKLPKWKRPTRKPTPSVKSKKPGKHKKHDKKDKNGNGKVDNGKKDTTPLTPNGDASSPSVGEASSSPPVGDASSPPPVGDASSSPPDGDSSSPLPDGDASSTPPDGEAPSTTSDDAETSTPPDGEAPSTTSGNTETTT